MPKKRRKTKRPGYGIAIAALLLNILIIPGLGSIIGKRVNTGVTQLILVIIGALLIPMVIGIPIIFVAWIWGLVTGIQLINESSK